MKRYKILIDFCKSCKKDGIKTVVSQNRYVTLPDYGIFLDFYHHNEVCVNNVYCGQVWLVIHIKHFLALLGYEPFASHRKYTFRHFKDKEDLLNLYLINKKPLYYNFVSSARNLALKYVHV